MYHINKIEAFVMYIEMEMDELKTRGGPLDKLINTAFDSVIIVDKNGFIIHCGTGADHRQV